MLSPYECGFNAFGDTRHRFDVRFYVIAILFIIFDLEIAFLFPWAIFFKQNWHVRVLVHDRFLKYPDHWIYL